MAWTQEDLMEHVPDDLYDKEYDKRYNPMAKKVTAWSRKKGGRGITVSGQHSLASLRQTHSSPSALHTL